MASEITPENKHTMLLVSILTGSTCGEACWEAREDVCRCSCGGKNHGCLRVPDGVRPARTAKLDGMPYTLKGVSVNRYELCGQADEVNKAAGPRSVVKIDDELTYTYTWRETDKGAPARVKPASKAQVERWPELSAYRDLPAYQSVYLLWIKGVS